MHIVQEFFLDSTFYTFPDIAYRRSALSLEGEVARGIQRLYSSGKGGKNTQALETAYGLVYPRRGESGSVRQGLADGVL
jgi:hypothetical protein